MKSYHWPGIFLKNASSKIKFSLEINSIGDSQSRAAYLTELTTYLKKYEKELSQDSQRRLYSNPLRILDSKDSGDKKIVETAPLLSDFLNTESQNFFDQVLSGLSSLQIPFQINPLLVRGLDYYSHSVFEFTTSHLGSQNAVLSGGRYDNLVETMGGPSTAGVGWAAGTDRIALLLEKPKRPHKTLALISASEKGFDHRFKLLDELRTNEIPSQMIYSGNISKQLKKASKRDCSFALIIGDAEIDNGAYQLKDLRNGAQQNTNKKRLACLSQKSGLVS